MKLSTIGAYIIALTAATLFAAGAQAASIKPYVSAAITYDSFDWDIGGTTLDDNSVGYKPALGVELKADAASNVAFGLEVGYRKYGKFEDQGMSLDIDGISVGAHVALEVSNDKRLRLRAHGGMLFADADATVPGFATASENIEDYFVGAGLDYLLTDNIRTGLYYEYQNADVDNAPDPDLTTIGLNIQLYF